MSDGISRREFLISSALIAGGTLAVGGLNNLLNSLDIGAPDAGYYYVNTGTTESIIPSVCLLCPSGCGIVSRVVDGRVVKIEGNPMHPINAGVLCPKGQAIPELLYNPDRLIGPMRRIGEPGSDEWEPITWEEAIQTVANSLNNVRANGHPERAALLYGETRGQMREFLERFMHAVGSPNAVSHDSLNVEVGKLAMYLTQGIYDLPAYDLEQANYILSFGANLLEAGRTPQRTIGGYAFMRRGRARRGKIVMIDPRQGVTGAKADEWIPIRPGTDAALALGIANVLISTGQFDSDFVQNYSFGFEDYIDDDRNHYQGFKNFVLENYAPAQVEEITGVSANTIFRLAGEFAENTPSVAIMPAKGGLLNGSVNGLYTAMAIHALNGMLGNIEKPGGVQVQRYMPCPPWPELPQDSIAEAGLQAERVDGAGTVFPVGRHAYQAVADRVLDGYPLDILMLYDANPVYEVPCGSRFIEAFEKIPLVVSFSSFMDDTARYADLILPEPTFMERFQDDHIEGVGFPGVGLRQPVVEPLYNTMHTGDFLLAVAKTIGGTVAEAFAWDSFEDVLKDRLSLIGASWEQLRDFGIWLTPGYRFARRGSTTWVNEVVGAERKKSPRDGRFDFFSRELRCLLQDYSPEQLQEMGISTTDSTTYLPHYEQVHVGDTVNVEYVQNLTIEVMENDGSGPGEGVMTANAVNTPDQAPGGMEMTTSVVKAIVEEINIEANTFKLKMPGGEVRQFEARNPENLKRAAVGDLVITTYTEAVAIYLAEVPAE